MEKIIKNITLPRSRMQRYNQMAKDKDMSLNAFISWLLEMEDFRLRTSKVNKQEIINKLKDVIKDIENG